MLLPWLIAPLLGILSPAALAPPSGDAASAVMSGQAAPAAVPARQVFTWSWTDGSRKTDRTFRKSRYGSIDRIPQFDVTVYPAYPPWKARLLFWVNGAWVQRDIQRSDANGRMRLTFDPRGPNGKWENLTWIVRAKLTDVSTTRSVALSPTGNSVEELRLDIRYVND